MDGISSVPVPSLPVEFAAGSLDDALRSGDPQAAGKVAKDFEGMFMSLVLKEMRQTLGPGSLFGNDSADIYGGLFDLFMGKHLVEAGGFGVAKMMEQYLSARTDSPKPDDPAAP